jgi:hypothetical protein
VLLGAHSDHERWNVNHLFSNGDMSLSDHNSSVVHRVGNLSLGNEGLESSFHELVDGKSKDVIELSLILFKQSESDDSSNEGITFELSSWVFLWKGEQLSGSFSQLGKSKCDSPHFSLVSEAILSDDSELVNKSISIEWLLWVLGSFPIIGVSLWHVHSMLLSLNTIVNNKIKTQHTFNTLILNKLHEFTKSIICTF